MSVRPSVRMEKLGSHWTDLREIWHLNIFRQSVQKVQVPLKSDKNKEDQYIFLITSRSFLPRTKNVLDKSCRENQNTHFVFNTFFL